MRRSELEHAIRAATEIVQQDSVLVIGSQAILASFHEDQLPQEAVQSFEVDIAPLRDDDRESLATRLDALIGEWSQFHDLHGFYVQGVGRRTAVLPDGWQDRLVRVCGPQTNNRTGLCLDPHDLCLAKLAAHREKDLRFVTALLDAGLVDPKVMRSRVSAMRSAAPSTRKLLASYLDTQLQHVSAQAREAKQGAGLGFPTGDQPPAAPPGPVPERPTGRKRANPPP